MKTKLTITAIKTVTEFPEHWTTTDFKELLSLFDFEDASGLAETELKDMLFMAIADRDPAEAARIVLDYRLGDRLNAGQIDQISNDMLLDAVSEEYSDISFHHPLFHINALLHKAYNGKFPQAKASVIDFELSCKPENPEVDKEFILKVFANGLNDHAILKRLFEEQLDSAGPFPDAEHIIWELEKTGDQNYRLITSEYWLDQGDLIAAEFEGSIPEA